ncbi:MAG: type II toxin-antitoxin system HicB family antitoxin [Candidatus Binataceae bacterium]
MASFLEYLDEAMRRAQYERMDSGEYFTSIPGFEGLWASGATIEDARRELWTALDGWLYVNALVAHLPLPELAGSAAGARPQKITD